VADILGSDEKISYITKNLFITMTANGRIGEVNKVNIKPILNINYNSLFMYSIYNSIDFNI